MSKPVTSVSIDEQVEVLMSNTGYGDDQTRQVMAQELRQRLIEAQEEGRPLRVYAGFDPRTSDLHLGHTIPIRKMRQFQDFGHEVIFLIGSFTSLIGDPDGATARDLLTMDEVAENARTYTEQAFKILIPSQTKVHHNSEWLSELNFLDVIKIAQNFTVQQFITREAFSNRIQDGDPIYLHEFFYPLMQGYDAVAMKVDVQIGGQDQLFNMMAGRQLMGKLGMKPQIVVAMGESLPGTDGVLKMSKSKGNHIPLLSEAGQMYTSIMRLPDSTMPLYFKLLLGYTQKATDDIMASIDNGERHIQEVKADMALEITTIFHGREAALAGQEFSRTAMQQGGIPDNIGEYRISRDWPLVDLLVEIGFCKSKGDARRAIDNKAISRDGLKVETVDMLITHAELPIVLQHGKRNFMRIVAE